MAASKSFMNILILFLIAIFSLGHGAPLSSSRSLITPSENVTLLNLTMPLSSGTGQSLPAPPSDYVLSKVLIGIGNITFSCSNATDDQTKAIPIHGEATLLDFFTHFPENEVLFHDRPDLLHTLPGFALDAQAAGYDLSPLVTAAFHGINQAGKGTGSYDEDGETTLKTEIVEALPAEGNNNNWSMAKSLEVHGDPDDSVLVYVVNTMGGGSPFCTVADHEIVVDLAAEFWMYEKMKL
ncbi:MAG: hypothetical protein Q9227_001462 [Pyrenula ochraceoflavens]